jgi:hypothetical protein
MTWYLLEILENRKCYTPAQLNDISMRMFAGSKNGWADGPEPTNVLTFVKRLDKQMPGFEAAYFAERIRASELARRFRLVLKNRPRKLRRTLWPWPSC